jgi:hypothetical protein
MSVLYGRAMPNWAEHVTAIFAGQQAREARIGRQAEMAVDFCRRWDEEPMVEARRLVAEFETPEALRDAMLRYIAQIRLRRTCCTGSSTISSSLVHSRHMAASIPS